MNDTQAVLFFLQTLHYRDDLESNLFQNLLNKTGTITTSEITELYNQKVHPELIKNTKVILESFKVLEPITTGFSINKNRLDYFINLVQMAKEARKYKWPEIKHKPFLFVSPPNLITTDLSGDVDDISNLLIGLVGSATNKITIMSPFTNKDGLKSVLVPLKACKNSPYISLYLTASEQDKNMICNQVKGYIPESMMKNLKIYFCTPELIKEDSLPHAKVLIVDSAKGYMGSANFTKQGLTSRFELGVELDKEQSNTVEKLLSMLVEKGVFLLYKNESI